MSSSSVQPSSPVAKWRAARRLYPIYCALASQFSLDPPPYDNLDNVDTQADPDFLGRVLGWFDTIDSRLHVAQFRMLVQNTAIASSEERLQALIDRHLSKPDRSEGDREKLDFLLVQYFAVTAPPTLNDRDLRIEDAAEVLIPVLGPVNLDIPEWLRPLDGWVASLMQFSNLSDLQSSQLAQQGRQLKASVREKYFTPTALVAFTRFSYLLRRTFLRLINAELKTIASGLEKLAGYGIATLDCSVAQMPAEVSVSELRKFCETYKKPALPEYSVDTSILRLIQLRQIVDAKLGEIEVPEDPFITEIEERCRRVEAELLEMRKLAARLAAERQRNAMSRGPAAAAAAVSAFEEVLEIPFELPGTQPASEEDPLAAMIATAPEAPPPAPLVAETPAPTPAPAAAPVPAKPQPAATTANTPIPTVNVQPAPPPPAQPLANHTADPSLTDAMEEIRKKLAAAPRKGISSLNIAGTALLLSPDEVEAFIRPKDNSSIDLQRSLAARALLLQAVELQKKTTSPELLAKTIQLCRTEAASIQQHSAEAKQANNNSMAAILNASASQLLSLLRQVERMSRAS